MVRAKVVIRRRASCLRGRWRGEAWNSGELVEERREAVPWEDGGIFAILAGGAAVDEPGGEGLPGELGTPVIETAEEIGGDGFAGLDFDCLEGVRRGFDEGIDFVAFLVAEEVERGLDAAVGLGLEEFCHDPIFKQGTALGVGADVAGVAHTEEPSGKAGIAEVELGSLDELELAGPYKNEAAHPAVGIDDALEVGKKIGGTLALIEDGSIGYLAEEGPRFFGGESAGVQIFQREIRQIRGEKARKRGLPDWRGPVIVRIGNPASRLRAAAEAMRGIVWAGSAGVEMLGMTIRRHLGPVNNPVCVRKISLPIPDNPIIYRESLCQCHGRM